MIAAARWLNPRKLRSSFSYRTRSLRKRLNSYARPPQSTSWLAWSDAAASPWPPAHALYMANLAMLFNGGPRRSAGVASISTQVLAASLRRRGTLHHDGVKDGCKLADIMSVCPGHDDRQRDATTVHQQVALAPIFSPDPSGSARQLAQPAAPSSWPRRYSAIARRCLQSRHTPLAQHSIGRAFH